jgi:osmotically-inducible protein OsmY
LSRRASRIRLIALFAALALSAPLGGCVIAAAGGAAAGGYAISQDRTLADQVNDGTLNATIVALWKKFNSDMADGLGCNVYEGRVLITGRVPNSAWRDDAVRIAWRVKGVQQVYNEIAIGPAPTAGDNLSDGWISTRLKNELLWDEDVRSVNFIVTTSGHVVYLTGVARTRAELERVTGYARNVPNVKRVVSYVQIMPGPAPMGQAAPPPTAQPAAAPESAPAAPRGAIEVQPLQ